MKSDFADMSPKRISGCYMPNKYIAVLKERNPSFKFPAYIRGLVADSMEHGYYGVYMLEKDHSQKCTGPDAEYTRFSASLSEGLIEQLSTMFYDKWQQDFDSFPLRPYLYWLIRRDVTGQTDCVIREKSVPCTPEYILRSCKAYKQKQKGFELRISKECYQRFLEKYGEGLPFNTYIKRLLNEGLQQRVFGVYTPERGKEVFPKTVVISKEFLAVLSDTFASEWVGTFPKFPCLKYIYWLIQKDLYS